MTAPETNPANLFLKFPKTLRIRHTGDDQHGKAYLSAAEVEDLLAGPVHVSEKVDGASVAIRVHDLGAAPFLQARGHALETGEHPQYQRFKAWAYEWYYNLPAGQAAGLLGKVLYGELCWARHALGYTRLPAWFLLFDMLDVSETEQQRWLPPEVVTRLASDYGLSMVPAVCEGRITMAELLTLLRRPSALQDGAMEGLYVKRHLPTGTYVRGKLLHPEFSAGIKGHWRARSIETNQLRAD